MALPLSTACISKSLTRTNPTTPFNSTPFSLTKTLNTKEPTRRALKTSPLHVAAPPHKTEYGVDDESGEEVNDSKFTWRDHWYPVSSLKDLDPLLPTPFQLLVRDLVLWFDKANQEWVAFDDQCPHRLAPLSVRRIDENGHLQCSYRGWSFDGCGWCAQIPQAMPEDPEAHAVKSPRAYATRSPTMVSQGLLFVWPDENGWERAQSSKPPMLPADLDKPEFSTVIIQHDLLYCYDTILENVSDPSQIDFSHHKVTGRRDRAKPLPFKVESSGSWGFAGTNDGNPRISAEFVAPCYYMNKVEIDTKLPIVGDQKWIIWICSFNVPMAPGKIHSTVCSARNFFQFTMPGLCQVVPRWHEHWTSNKVYDGDMIVFQGKRRYFFHNPWEVLDRFEPHTRKCSSCKRAYEFQTLQKFLIGATVAFCATAGIPSDQFRAVLAALALVSAGLAYTLNQHEKNFVFIDYVHAEID
ncbi:hypothetical protein BDE02_09G002100 [Populus trichocarpa]|nr:hypothetical protein BDE02_09G002100 [Populus trichocarpa]